MRADPRVAGLPTSGYATQLQIDADGKVVGGGGYLGKPTDAASYPLVSAKEAFDALPELPRPMFACLNAKDCPAPEPAKVTGAELGLQLTALADDEASLLPAWLFTVTGWPAPLAQPAIEPRFLTFPSAEPVPVASDQLVPPEPRTDAGAVRGSKHVRLRRRLPDRRPERADRAVRRLRQLPAHERHASGEGERDSVVVTLEGDRSRPTSCTATTARCSSP